jgi:hypothetical protein
VAPRLRGVSWRLTAVASAGVGFLPIAAVFIFATVPCLVSEVPGVGVYSEPPPRWPLSRPLFISTMQAAIAASRVWNFILQTTFGPAFIFG